MQILRLDKNLWIQTSDSDGMPLQEQSELSKMSLEKCNQLSRKEAILGLDLFTKQV